MSRLAIFLLGSPRIELDGDELHIPRRKATALLAYLALEKRSHRRDSLAALLWPEYDQRGARGRLRRALSSLNLCLGEGYLGTNRETVELRQIQPNSGSELWLDVDAFRQTLSTYEAHRHSPATACAACAVALEDAVVLYRDDFLAGFSLPDSLPFDEWVHYQSESLRDELGGALKLLATCLAAQGKFDDAIVHTRRWIDLDPLRESAHRFLMELYARGGRRTAAVRQYRVCTRILEQELGAPPSAETATLYERIRTERTRPPQPEAKIEPIAPPVRSVPTFLDEQSEPMAGKRSVFVARECELARLDGFLEAVLAGLGCVVFVTGGPGRGKTALMDEFARRAMDAHSDLLVTKGNCNAYSGVGDPYLPFREVTGMLAGDVEAMWNAGAITQEHAQRLWAALPLAAHALLDHGPHLMDIFVSGSRFLSHVRSAVPEEVEFLRRLEALVSRRKAETGELEQGFIFEQYTNTLKAVAARHPLLLLLDDLQWVDTASAGLLFHLGRRLAGSRILILCAYRPEEVAPGRDGARHPLAKVLSEFKRYSGDVWVDLTQADNTEGKRFVETFLDIEPNCLDGAFRAALYLHTEGHPLFTVELLRSMQERGDLIKDDDGHWSAGPRLNWDVLPPRVEGVIEERIGRLEDELRDVLSVASVEGEEFTAQVVARVQMINDRQLLQKLSRELEKRHHLVQEQGMQRAGARQLSRFRFAHALFRQFLYTDLSIGERILLHQDIAGVLEELYEGRVEEIAVQLAHHHACAGNAERERYYAKLAGQRAAAQYANQEALRHLSRALELTPEEDYAERFDILMHREKAHNLQGDREAQYQDLVMMEDLAARTGDHGLRVTVALRWANYHEATDDFSSVITEARKAVCLAQVEQDLQSEAAGCLLWGGALVRQGEYDVAREHLERSLALTQVIRTPQSPDVSLRRQEADVLRKLGEISLNEGNFDDAKALHSQALAIDREIGDRQGEGRALNNLGVVCVERGDPAGAKDHYKQALPILQEIGDRRGEGRALNNIGVAALQLGHLDDGRMAYEQSRAIFREIGSQRGEAAVLTNLGELCLAQGEYGDAYTYLQQALQIVRDIGHRRIEILILAFVGDVFLAQGDYVDAKKTFEDALAISRDVTYLRGKCQALSGASLVSHYLGDDKLAQDYSQQALAIAQEIDERDSECYALTRLGHALAGLGHLEDAADCYQNALESRRDLGQLQLALPPRAGLARVRLAQGDLAQALHQTEEILNRLETGPVIGTPQPLEIYLTCYHVLEAHDDPRARDILKTAYHTLQDRASKLNEDQMRHSFLNNVAVHREIVAIWERENISAQRSGQG
jgi:adenylate cyclase